MEDVEIIGMLKSYVSKTLVGMGALKGANCQIESIVEVTGGQKITFLWMDSNNVSHRSELTVPNGGSIDSISVNGVAQTISNKAVNLDVASNLITEEQWTQIQALLV